MTTIPTRPSPLTIPSCQERAISRLLTPQAGMPSAQNAAGYNWSNVPMGGGGFVTGIFPAKTQQGVVYARTDVGVHSLATPSRTIFCSPGLRAAFARERLIEEPRRRGFTDTAACLS